MFLVNGSLFLAADFSNARRLTNFRLLRESQETLSHLPARFSGNNPSAFPPHLRDRIRVTGETGQVVFQSDFFDDIPFSGVAGFSTVTVQNEPYDIFTAPIQTGDEVTGYLQIVEAQRARLSDVPPRVQIYILVSLVISGLTFFVGLFFAKRSLRPAEEMLKRLEQFTQDASHELRTPLAVLGSSLDVALKTQKYKEGLVSAKEDLVQISTLVDRLLELTRLDTLLLDRSDIDFSGLVTETTRKLELLAREKSIALTTTIAPNVSLSADPSLMKQVINNLVSNAIKFNRPGGSISVSLTPHALTISDTGIGISEEKLPNIFKRFFRVEDARSQEGYGLGLALVKRILALHDFKIAVSSTLGKGTTFTITFA